MRDDGFYHAENEHGGKGLVPSNHVVAEDELESGSEMDEDVNDFPVDTIVQALYPYDPEGLSPNVDIDEDLGPERELAFQMNDRFKILKPIDEDGFYFAEHLLSGKTGLVPSNFIREEEDEIQPPF